MKPACPSIALVPSFLSMVMHSNCSSMTPPHLLQGRNLYSRSRKHDAGCSTKPSTLALLPRQVAESSTLTDEMNAEQDAQQPNRSYRKTGP